MRRRLIIAMTGSTGAIFGVRMLEAIKSSDIESHLIISKWAQRTLEHETRYTVEQVRGLASVVHSPGDMGASISSGSFRTEGMAVMPCSVRTLAGIANGYGEHLVHRAADVVLKERRRLVLLVRETPLSEVHLENMLKLSRMGVSIVPPVPAFYNHPQTVDDIVKLLRRALEDVERGLGGRGLEIEDAALIALAHGGDGDARRALGMLEVVADLAEPLEGAPERARITLEQFR